MTQLGGTLYVKCVLVLIRYSINVIFYADDDRSVPKYNCQIYQKISKSVYSSRYRYNLIYLYKYILYFNIL